MSKLSNWKHIAICTVAVLAGAGFWGVDAAQSRQNTSAARTLYQQALHERDATGNLKAAITLYERVLASKPDRALAAQALIGMAECYQKLGNAESRRLYEQVVREYADQTDAVVTARSQLGNTARPMTSTRVASVDVGGVGYGSVSPDGRYFPYTNWENGDIYLRDLVTGGDRRVTNVSGLDSDGQFATKSTFSRDGRQLAYSWNGTRMEESAVLVNRSELRVASLDGVGFQTRLLFANEDVSSIRPDDWSSDGRWLAVQVTREDKSSQIGLVAVQDGSLRILESIDWRGATRLQFSPDSRYLAYDLPVQDKTNERDIFILSVDGAQKISVAPHRGNDVVMGWSPSGDYLLFSSDRTGKTGLWQAKFADGKVSPTPEPVKSEIAGAPLGVARNGSLYLLVSHPSFLSRSANIQVAEFDFETGKLASKPTSPIQSFLGSNSNPRWSRDGKYLAYVSNRPPMTGSFEGSLGDHVIGIRAVDTGQVRELRPALSMYPPQVEWAADGRSFFTQGTDLKGRQGIYRIDAQTGEVSPIAINLTTNGELRSPRASPDGKKLYYVAAPSKQATVETSVIEHDLDTAIEKTILAERTAGAISLSPDGNYLAFTRNDPASKSNILLRVSTRGGETKEISRVAFPQGIGVHAWMSDGAVLANKAGVLWKFPINGGEPVKLDRRLAGFNIHPDGRQIAYVVTEPAKPAEVWVLENFWAAQKSNP